MNRIFPAVLATTVLLALGACSPREEKAAAPAAPAAAPQPAGLQLGCANPGTPQDPYKTPAITNTTGQELAVGHVINWTSSDGDSGTITLEAPLAAGGAVQGTGTKSGQAAYTCEATTPAS